MAAKLLRSGCALLALIAATPLYAQEAEQVAEDDGRIADIVVTAQRREQNVQDVPIAISAFSGEQLREQGVTSALDIGQFVPNLVAQNNTGLGSANAYYLRGLGNTETIPTFDPPVGTYVDDIYLSRQNANNLNLFDVARVEVLRGPQGTLFGRNTTGGAINVILAEPKDEFGGYAEIGYGRFDKKLARASIDVPLAPTFAVKISGYWQDDDGYVRNVTTNERLNDDDGWGARIGFRGELSDSVRWTGSYAHIVANGENLLNQECSPVLATNCEGRFASSGLRKNAGPNPYAPLVISGRKAGYGLSNNTDTDIVTSNLQFGLGERLTLNFITGFVSQIQQYALDFADGRALPNLANPNPAVRGDPRGGFTIINDGQHEQFSQEVKLSGSLANGFIDLVAGAFYLKETNRTDFADVFTVNPTFVLLTGDRTLRNSTEASAGYVQADFNLTDQIKLTAGVRYTDETKEFSIRDNRPVQTVVAGTLRCGVNPTAVPTALCLDNSNLFGPSGLAIPRSQTTKIWTPRFAASFRPSDDLLFFASATRGFKSGGWNARGTAPNQLLPFGPEKVWSYEAGFKSDFFDRRVRFNLTAYRANVTDLQTPSALATATGIAFLTRNFADYRNQGIEAEFTFVPVDGLNLYANGGYQDDKYIINRSAPALDQYGIQSVASQQAECRAAIATGAIPGGTSGVVPPRISTCASGIIDANGNIASPVRTPEFTLAVGGSYSLPLGGMTLVPSVNGSYRSKSEVQTSNYTIYTGAITGTNGIYPANPFSGTPLQGSKSAAAWLVNASLALNGPDKAWQLSVQCTNCFDETYVQSSLANTTYLNQPMMWQVRARYDF